jgi:hypothetical protein
LTKPLEDGINLGISNKLLGIFDLMGPVRILPKTHAVNAVMAQGYLEPVLERFSPF